jgi:hypothetical protein
MGPERVVARGVILIPEPAAGMRFDAPGIEAPLERHVFRGRIERREILVAAEHGVAMIENRIEGTGIQIDRVRSVAGAKAHVAKDDVVTGNAKRIPLDAEPIPWRSLARDGDLRCGHSQGAGNRGVTTHVKDDRPTSRGNARRKPIGERARTRRVCIRHVIHVAAAAALGIGARAFRAGKGRDLTPCRHPRHKQANRCGACGKVLAEI